jgi:hypothetical protein
MRAYCLRCDAPYRGCFCPPPEDFDEEPYRPPRTRRFRTVEDTIDDALFGPSVDERKAWQDEADRLAERSM